MRKTKTEMGWDEMVSRRLLYRETLGRPRIFV